MTCNEATLSRYGTANAVHYEAGVVGRRGNSQSQSPDLTDQLRSFLSVGFNLLLMRAFLNFSCITLQIVEARQHFTRCSDTVPLMRSFNRRFRISNSRSNSSEMRIGISVATQRLRLYIIKGETHFSWGEKDARYAHSD